jgi:Fe-S-cluster containining protein
MSTGTPSDSHSLRGAVAIARKHPLVLHKLAAVYASVDDAVSATDARCMGGGTCCRFDLAGHRLYVTTLELAMLLEHPSAGTVAPLRCPYQRGPRCLARFARPLGCRTYFCRAPQLMDLYESFHQQIAALHEAHGIPYFYVELTSALDQCANTPD